MSKDPEDRERQRQELIAWEDAFFKERARRIDEWIHSDRDLMKELEESLAAADRGEMVPAREVYERWRKGRMKPI